MTKINSKNDHSVRKLAYQLLLKFELEKARLDDLEKDVLKHTHLSQQDRRVFKNLVSGVIRNLYYLDWILTQFYQGKYTKLLAKAKTILRLALYELIYMSFIPEHATVDEYVKMAKKKIGIHQSKMVNAVLRNYLRRKDQIKPEKHINDKEEYLSIKYSFPKWLVKRWISLWSETRTEELLEAFSSNPQFDFYVNRNKANAKKIEAVLKENQVEFEKSELFPEVYKIKNLQKLIASDILEKGLGTIQDESAHIPVELLDLQENDIVLDVCAAPGGKFLQIVQRSKINLITIAVDINKNRLKKVKENLERLEISHPFLVVADGRNLPFKSVFTKILLDAPCSGLGVITKHPDIKWRRTMKEIREFADLQKQLMDEASRLLKKNGTLVYSTCTIDPLENEDVINDFLNKQSGKFVQQNIPEQFAAYIENKILRTFPDRDQMDGSFGAILRKM